MRSPFVVSMFVLACLAVPVHSQRTAESASHQMIADVLDQLECKWEQDDWKYHITLNKRKLTLFRLDNGKRLLLKASVKEQPSLEVLNRYNVFTAVTTRAVRYEKLGVLLETGVDCQLGISEPGLKKLITRFVSDVAGFETFIAKNADKGDSTIVKKSEKQKVPLTIAKDSDDKEFTITFPTNQPTNWHTSWKILWDMEDFDGTPGRRVFNIKKAFFKPSQQSEWIQVLEGAYPQEFYVPYYFRGTRFFDGQIGGYVGLSAKEGGATSQLLSKSKRVMAELRDTGPAYKHGDITRRGEELTLWANFGAANYTYMVEFGFRDDGVIVFRHSPTGYNYFSHFDASHMHGSYWHIGMKLGPEGNNDTNTVFTVKLPTDPKEQGDGGKMKIDEVTRESFYDWNPLEFTRLRVTNPNYSTLAQAKIPPPDPNKPKGKGKGKPVQQPDLATIPISYDLVTYPQGTARHRRFADEKFTHHDFWITRQDSPERMYIRLGKYFFDKDGDLNPQLKDLDKKNVVLWHASSALHTPRSEDGIIGGSGTANGQANVFWTTFELRPRNIFLKTPLYRANEETPPKVDVRKDIERPADGLREINLGN